MVDLTQRKRASYAPSIPFHIEAILAQATRISSHSWEYATTAEAGLELYNPELGVFASDPFPEDKLPTISDIENCPSLTYIQPLIYTEGPELQSSPGTIGDPPSLGTFALLLGQANPNYRAAAQRQLDYILSSAPRYSNGAISHWRDHAELWGDFIYMTPPFLAYSAIAFDNLGYAKEAFQQIKLYREILRCNEAGSMGDHMGLWRHIAGSKNADPEYWTTAMGWVLAGMLRVFATLTSWTPASTTLQAEIKDLEFWILELIEAIIRIDSSDPDHQEGPSTGRDKYSPSKKPLLLRNYLTDATYFRETAGTSLIVASIFRAALLFPGSDLSPPLIPPEYTTWATRRLDSILSSDHLNRDTGIVGPACYALDHFRREPIWTGSAEGQAFAVLAWAAWRDWVQRGRVPEK